MLYYKITHGYVMQKFNDLGDCVEQEFVAGDEVEYEQDGSPINMIHMPRKGHEYHPFNMEQPNDPPAMNLAYLKEQIQENVLCILERNQYYGAVDNIMLDQVCQTIIDTIDKFSKDKSWIQK